MPDQQNLPGSDGKPTSRQSLNVVRQLVPLYRFLRPYWRRILGASVALVISSATVLVLGQGLRYLVDQGLTTANTSLLDRAVGVLLATVLVLAVSSYFRFYLVSWIGERVVADLRRAVFDRIITLSPAYFEIRRTGDILSRLTTDTTLLQTVIGSSLSQGLRNGTMLGRGLPLLVLTRA